MGNHQRRPGGITEYHHHRPPSGFRNQTPDQFASWHAQSARRGEPHLCPKNPTASAPKKLVQGTRQGHPLGTPQWLELYRKGRSQIESVNSMLRGNTVHTPQRTWCRVRGRAKTGLLFGLQCMASNTLQLWNHDVIEPEH